MQQKQETILGRLVLLEAALRELQLAVLQKPQHLVEVEVDSYLPLCLFVGAVAAAAGDNLILLYRSNNKAKSERKLNEECLTLHEQGSKARAV